MYNFRDYLGFAERYVICAEEENVDTNFFLIPSVLLSWVAIESFINNMIDDFASLPEDMFELHERALLLEQRVRFVDEGVEKGTFVLEKKEFRRLEEKIFFLLAKFGKTAQLSKGDKLWQNFEKLKDLRNDIMHPRKYMDLKLDMVIAKHGLTTSKEIISFVSTHVSGKPIEL